MGSDVCGIYEDQEVIVNPNINWGDNEAIARETSLNIDILVSLCMMAMKRHRALIPKSMMDG